MEQKERRRLTKNKILTVCVRLFLEKGYHKTTMLEITKEAEVSLSSFQNLFHTKDGVLLDLAEIMFENQFAAARGMVVANNPVLVYATETAIQITLTELNENLREVYVAAYSNEDALEYLYKRTSGELKEIFAAYNPNCSMSDFYEMDIGSSGIMRNYMARKCDQYFTLEKKLTQFINMGLKAYNVPEAEIKEAVDFVLSLDIRSISNQVMHKLFEALAMQFNFSLEEIEVQR